VYHNDAASVNSLSDAWAVDIWSLGCVFSEAAVWIAEGYTGVLGYRSRRKDETNGVLSKDVDAFHDGKRPLQSVIDTHRDIEDSLRRSDHITKDVLESMVDEMLWEEDRPTANALLRKSNMIVSRSRQKLSAKSQNDITPRSANSRSQRLPPARPPPTQPLPPIPRAQLPGLVSITEQHYVPNVDQWRSQVKMSRNVNSDGKNESPIISKRRVRSAADSLDLRSRKAESVASWKVDDDSRATSPITPFTSSHTSQQFESHRHANEEKSEIHPALRPFHDHDSYQTLVEAPQALNHRYELPEDATKVLNFPSVPSNKIEVNDKRPTTAPLDQQDRSWYDKRLEQPVTESVTVDRTMSRTESRQSFTAQAVSRTQSVDSQEAKSPTERQKHSGGFSLFPLRSRRAHSSSSNLVTSSNSSKPREPLFAILNPRYSVSSGSAARPDSSSDSGHLSIDACLEWKNSPKKAKKSLEASSLLGEDALARLRARDHVRHSSVHVIVNACFG
jgi:hypothetical protein